MSATISRPSDEEASGLASDGLASSSAPAPGPLRLAALPVGARLILRCRADWRAATVVAVGLDAVTLSVTSPRGRTYRVRRPPDSALSLDGAIPVLGSGSWRVGLARYDARW